jgi:hypothetical protein
MGDDLGPNGLSGGLQGSLLQVDVAEIIGDEADEPNALVDFLAAETLSGQHGGDVDLLAVQADAAASPGNGAFFVVTLGHGFTMGYEVHGCPMGGVYGDDRDATLDGPQR